MRYNHLKLMARVPLLPKDVATFPTPHSKSDHAFKYICLARYTSSIGARKAGMLEIYDAAIHRFLLEDVGKETLMEQGIEVGTDLETVKHTRLYDIVVATGMCMIIGEWQKRKTIRILAEIALGEAAGSAGN